MGFSDAMRIAAGGMEAERVRMNVLAGNLANSQSVHGNPRGVFERRDVIFAAVRPGHSFLTFSGVHGKVRSRKCGSWGWSATPVP